MKPSDPLFVQDAPTRGEGFSIILTAKDGALPLIIRKGNKNGQRRRQIVITNTSGSLNARIVLGRPVDCPDSAEDDYSILIYPTTTISLFTDCDVTIVNGNAQSIRLAISEIFYT